MPPTAQQAIVAGTGSITGAFSGDGGPATTAELNAPVGIKVDGAGNLYIADVGNNRIRLVNAAGTISTIAGNGTAGFSGDGGIATSAMLNSPIGVAVGSFSPNIVYISDDDNNRIRGLYATAGVAQINKAAGIVAYPNPAHDEVTVVAATAPGPGAQITLTDVAGHVVYGSPMLLKTQTINLQRLPAGIYVLQMTDSTGAKTNVKVVKE